MLLLVIILIIIIVIILFKIKKKNTRPCENEIENYDEGELYLDEEQEGDEDAHYIIYNECICISGRFLFKYDTSYCTKSDAFFYCNGLCFFCGNCILRIR